MAKPIVTETQVVTIADELHAGGTEPTIILVQERIGSGSYTTIKRYLDAWKQHQAHQPVVEVPPDVTAKGMAAIQTIWATAAQLAQEQTAHDRAEAQRQVAEAQTALATAEAAITRQEADAEQLGVQLADYQQQIETLTAQLAQARTEAATATATVQEQAQRVSDLQPSPELATRNGARLPQRPERGRSPA